MHCFYCVIYIYGIIALITKKKFFLLKKVYKLVYTFFNIFLFVITFLFILVNATALRLAYPAARGIVQYVSCNTP